MSNGCGEASGDRSTIAPWCRSFSRSRATSIALTRIPDDAAIAAAVAGSATAALASVAAAAAGKRTTTKPFRRAAESIDAA
jgi:hypothetical protein